ncbi:hypothetical protein EJC49_24360, partial [Aquibium carbonis]
MASAFRKSPKGRSRTPRSFAPPSVLPDISPTRGEIGSPASRPLFRKRRVPSRPPLPAGRGEPRVSPVLRTPL